MFVRFIDADGHKLTLNAHYVAYAKPINEGEHTLIVTNEGVAFVVAHDIGFVTGQLRDHAGR